MIENVTADTFAKTFTDGLNDVIVVYDSVAICNAMLLARKAMMESERAGCVDLRLAKGGGFRCTFKTQTGDELCSIYSASDPISAVESAVAALPVNQSPIDKLRENLDTVITEAVSRYHSHGEHFSTGMIADEAAMTLGVKVSDDDVVELLKSSDRYARFGTHGNLWYRYPGGYSAYREVQG